MEKSPSGLACPRRELARGGIFGTKVTGKAADSTVQYQAATQNEMTRAVHIPGFSTCTGSRTKVARIAVTDVLVCMTLDTANIANPVAIKKPLAAESGVLSQEPQQNRECSTKQTTVLRLNFGVPES
ncbi:MAG: hypothetical protein AAF456_12675 [Planctomycetota bacterium]